VVGFVVGKLDRLEDTKMKRYIVFMVLEYGATGGWDDVLTADWNEHDIPSLFFDTVEEAIEASVKDLDRWDITIVQVVDLHEGRVIFESSVKDINQKNPPAISNFFREGEQMSCNTSQEIVQNLQIKEKYVVVGDVWSRSALDHIKECTTCKTWFTESMCLHEKDNHTELSYITHGMLHRGLGIQRCETLLKAD